MQKKIVSVLSALVAHFKTTVLAVGDALKREGSSVIWLVTYSAVIFQEKGKRDRQKWEES